MLTWNLCRVYLGVYLSIAYLDSMQSLSWCVHVSVLLTWTLESILVYISVLLTWTLVSILVDISVLLTWTLVSILLCISLLLTWTLESILLCISAVLKKVAAADGLSPKTTRFCMALGNLQSTVKNRMESSLNQTLCGHFCPQSNIFF